MPRPVQFAPLSILARVCSVIALGLALTVPAGRAVGVETVTFRPPGSRQTKTVVGKILVEAADGGVMLQAVDGHIWTLQPEMISNRTSDDIEFVPIDDDEMAKRLLEEMPAGFRVYRTSHYVILHNGSEARVRKVGTLFEQLYRGFFAYWRNKGWKLEEPSFPLVSVVFSDHQGFLRYGEADIGEMAKSLIGYYHLESNRMITFNVPNLERNIATIIHEATHQLAYNCGVQQRFADNPMWVSEGLATFFEAPDFRNPRGWRTIGRKNEVNFARWKRYIPHRPSESLTTLLADDSRYRSASSSPESFYAESWALTYFLIKTRTDQYVTFMKRLSEGKPLVYRSPQERIELVEEVFETTLADLDKQLVAYMKRLR